MANTSYINNWDLVDISAPNIVGAFLLTRSKKPLYQLAKSKSLWERRIAVLATFYFIKNNQFDDSLKIAGILLQDKEDLIHKAVGWMLREIGKRDIEVRGIVFTKALPDNAPNHAALRDRKIYSIKKAQVYEW